MRSLDSIQSSDIQTVYSGAEGKLWELLMGEQIHIGGLTSSMHLAEKAQIKPQTTGVDLCCCSGAGMRFLLRFRDVDRMHGVDMTSAMIDLGKQRCADEGYADRATFILAKAIDTGLPDGQFDFVWGEDAWCYVDDKPSLIKEATRLIKPGGTIAFTDWCEGPAGLSDEQAQRFLAFMKFPSFATCDDYRHLLEANNCDVLEADDTGQFPPHVDLYIDMVSKQLTYDALKIIGFDQSLLQQIAGELGFVRTLAHEKRIIQARFIAHKREA